MPSVLSPTIVSPSNFSVLTAPATLRARRQIVRKLRGVDLERQRDVETAVAGFAQRQRLVFESVERRFDALVGELMFGLLRESLMNLRRTAMRDRVTDNSVLVDGH